MPYYTIYDKVIKKTWSNKYLNWFDIQLWLHPVATGKLVGRKKGEGSVDVARRVMQARSVQAGRFKSEGIFTNAEMNNRLLERFCPLNGDCRKVMENLMDKLGLSARAYSRILKVARTIADLEGVESIRPEFLAEAAAYRFLDKRDEF